MSDIELVAKSYYSLLTSIDWEDEVLLSGLREGLNKFLSNAFLKIRKRKKYLQGDFYSKKALLKVLDSDFSGLVYEHMVPKQKYIQKPCEEKAKNGDLTYDFIVDILEKYWKIAVITREEDELLEVTKMPDDWDGENYKIRYQNAGIALVEG